MELRCFAARGNSCSGPALGLAQKGWKPPNEWLSFSVVSRVQPQLFGWLFSSPAGQRGNGVFWGIATLLPHAQLFFMAKPSSPWPNLLLRYLSFISTTTFYSPQPTLLHDTSQGSDLLLNPCSSSMAPSWSGTFLVIGQASSPWNKKFSVVLCFLFCIQLLSLFCSWSHRFLCKQEYVWFHLVFVLLLFSKIGEMKAQHSIKNSAKRIDCTNWDAKQRARNGCHALTYKP